MSRIEHSSRGKADGRPHTNNPLEIPITAEADIVIGCNGIKSRVRRELGFSDSPTYSGQVVHRGFIEYKDLLEDTATLLRNVVNFCSPKRNLLCLPICNPATQTDRVGVIGFMTGFRELDSSRRYQCSSRLCEGLVSTGAGHYHEISALTPICVW